MDLNSRLTLEKYWNKFSEKYLKLIFSQTSWIFFFLFFWISSCSTYSPNLSFIILFFNIFISQAFVKLFYEVVDKANSIIDFLFHLKISNVTINNENTEKMYIFTSKCVLQLKYLPWEYFLKQATSNPSYYFITSRTSGTHCTLKPLTFFVWMVKVGIKKLRDKNSSSKTFKSSPIF